MQSETGFPSRPSHQLKSYVASKSRLKLAARAVLSADAGLLVCPVKSSLLVLASLLASAVTGAIQENNLYTSSLKLHAPQLKNLYQKGS